MPSRNLAARAGRWSALHPWRAILGWIAFVVISLVIGSVVGTKHQADQNGGSGDSRAARQVLAHAGFKEPAGESVLIQARSGPITDAPGRAAITSVVATLKQQPNVVALRSPLTPDGKGAISRDGRSALVQFDIRGKAADSTDKIDPILKATSHVAADNPDYRIEEFGDASADKALSKALGDDFSRAEILSLPITLFILVLAFGALVAAGIPVLLAMSGVGATIGLVALPSQIWPVDKGISSVILLIGLAVGVDYTMFYIRREREERAAGRGPIAAIEAAAATSGRAVLVSGLTVMSAMAGMYLTGSEVFTSFATGTILVVAVAMLGSVTVLPALLAKLGDRIDKGRVPFIHRLRARSGAQGGRFWSWILDRVLRRPVVSAVAATAVLVGLAIPALGMHTALAGVSSLSRDIPIMQTYDRMQAAFPGGQLPAQVVLRADDVTSPAARAAIADLRKRALASGEMKNPIEVNVSPSHQVARITIPLDGKGTDAKSNHALQTLRHDLIPATIGKLPNSWAGVAGETAGSKDFNDQMASHLPYVFAFVLLMAFALLLVTFRSIVIPLKAIALNLLSVGAAYGVLVLVFQKGWFSDELGFKPSGAITSWLPIFLFVVLFGLSMDYHVFILSRVRELFDRGRSTEEAVSEGIKATAGVVTSAAAVMVAVFAIFATLSSIEMKEMGLGLAVAVFLDATLVRAVLLPAAMKLLGDWNWYLPRWMRWLPQVGHEPEPARA